MNTSYDLYLVTQQDLSEGRSTPEIVEAAIAGGVDAIQLREKHASARDRYELGLGLRKRTREAGVSLLVNDRVDIAAAIDADGVHLGDEDLPIAAAREILGQGAVIGRSVSTVEGAHTAESNGADYLGAGAVFATASKNVADEQNAIGVESVEKIAESVGIPIVGIGGIDRENAASVTGAGASGVAVISAITTVKDPEAATRELLEAVREGRR
ncbi:MAG: thiamine phosphate synthase [Euryarchaeota archaeon]|nr:thiamine phosphate synthase [Euryarchaeota archaeon]